jgi:alkylation response protein AidB-like acyl-CoA dehydrogenase
MDNLMGGSAAARGLEEFLGDPREETARLSFARVVEADEHERYPGDVFPELDEWGLRRFYVPEALGGRLTSWEQLFHIARVLARRDITTTFSHGLNTLLGAEAVWVAGTAEQQRVLADHVLGGARVAFAFSERHHGADLVRSDVTARRAGEAYLLSGEKWTIGNATRGRLLTVFARTSPDGGSRGSSLFLVDKAAVADGALVHGPKIRTLGLRGADVSSIEFRDARLDATARIGREGEALELAVRSMQISRTLAPALSIGACDTVLRAATSWLLDRRLYGARAFDIAYVRAALADAFCMHLLCECVATHAVRALHVAPQQMSVVAAIAKYLVPTLAEEILSRVSMTMGARFFLREGHYAGIVQKMLRDAWIADFGHGSPMVNLQTVAIQLRALLTRKRPLDAHALALRLEEQVTFDGPLRAFDPAALAVAAGGMDDAIAATHEQLRGEPPSDVDPEVWAALRERAERLVGYVAALTADVAGSHHLGAQSPQLYELARRYALAHAGSVGLHAWLFNRARASAVFADGTWLVLALDTLLFARRPAFGEANPAWIEATADRLRAMVEDDAMLSGLPWRLPRGSRPA